MLQTILSKCDERYQNSRREFSDCSYPQYLYDCEACLEHVHHPDRFPQDPFVRHYDCKNMADYYTCKYSCKYTSELIYGLRRMDKLRSEPALRVLSFGCGPCTDLFALDQMQESGELTCQTIDYRGIDCSKDTWENVHKDIKGFENEMCTIRFYYTDVIDIMADITRWTWTPNLIVFQYLFSDMLKHSGDQKTRAFIDRFAAYYNEKILPDTYIILNDTNLHILAGGGRDYFDLLAGKLFSSSVRKGRFFNAHSQSAGNPRGYPYGEDSDGEFSQNKNLFTAIESGQWDAYSPATYCKSAQMVIRKEG